MVFSDMQHVVLFFCWAILKIRSNWFSFFKQHSMSRVKAITLLSNGSVFACIVVIFHCDKVFFCVLFLSCLSSISCLILLQQREPEYFRYFALCSKRSKSIRLCRKLISFRLVHFPTLKLIMKLESLLPTNYQTLKIKLYLSPRKKKAHWNISNE